MALGFPPTSCLDSTYYMFEKSATDAFQQFDAIIRKKRIPRDCFKHYLPHPWGRPDKMIKIQDEPTNPNALRRHVKDKAQLLTRHQRQMHRVMSPLLVSCDVLSSNLTLYIAPCSHRVISCYLFSRPVTACHVTTCTLDLLISLISFLLLSLPSSFHPPSMT